MKKTNIAQAILSISIVSGIYFLINILTSSNKFKNDFNEFETSTELIIELDNGTYDLFELSSELNSNIKSNNNYIISETGKNPKIIEIKLDPNNSIRKNKTTITYTIFNNKFKSIGTFEINKKQNVKIVSNINDGKIDKFAYRQKGANNSFFGIIKFSFLLLLSISGVLISGIILFINRKNG